jgi:hypothetical protein
MEARVLFGPGVAAAEQVLGEAQAQEHMERQQVETVAQDYLRLFLER